MGAVAESNAYAPAAASLIDESAQTQSGRRLDQELRRLFIDEDDRLALVEDGPGQDVLPPLHVNREKGNSVGVPEVRVAHGGAQEELAGVVTGAAHRVCSQSSTISRHPSRIMR